MCGFGCGYGWSGTLKKSGWCSSPSRRWLTGPPGRGTCGRTAKMAHSSCKEGRVREVRHDGVEAVGHLLHPLHITAALKANISEYVVGKHPPEPGRRQPGRALHDVPHRPPWCCSPLSCGGAQRLSRTSTACHRLPENCVLTKMMAPSSTEKRSKIGPLKMITRHMVTSRCRCPKPRVSKANAKAERDCS